MAGKPGRSGGARVGAGRPRKPKPDPEAIGKAIPADGDDTLKLLQDIAFGRVQSTSLQVRAAIAAVQYTHTKKGDGGKKEETAGRAKKAAAGKFAAAPAPLKLVGGRK